MVRNILRGSFTKWPGNINVDAAYIVCVFTSFFMTYMLSGQHVSHVMQHTLCSLAAQAHASSGHETLQAAFNSLQLFRLFYEQLLCQCYDPHNRQQTQQQTCHNARTASQPIVFFPLNESLVDGFRIHGRPAPHMQWAELKGTL